jgi:acyl carrier protein
VNADFIAVVRRGLRFLPPDQDLPADAPLRSLGLDSLGAVALIFELEEEYGITFPDSSFAAGTFETAGRLWAAVQAARLVAG